RFHAQSRRPRPAVASLEVPLDNRALLRRWCGFRTIGGGAPCIAARLDVFFPVDWLSHSQVSRPSNTPRLRCRTNRLDGAALHICSPRCPAVTAVSGAEPPPHSPVAQIDAEAITAPGATDATEMQQSVPLRFYPS